MNRQKSLQHTDKFYTKQNIASHIVDITLNMFPHINNFVEPSAGSGNIRDEIEERKKEIISYDILPEGKNIIKADYLQTFITPNKHITIGNPPFGYKGNSAIQFLNKALNESIAVAFIMPITALKYSLQKQVNKYAKLIYQENLPIDSFELPNKAPYKCPSCFQIWTLQETNYKNLREQKPIISHNDFICYRHNATKISQKYINYNWDFAVYCQGRKDYKKIFTKDDYDFLKERINNSSDQFYFFKTKNDQVLHKLLSINWEELAYVNHITPGFCKNDIVKKYIEICQM